jgi:hypothetical protein
MKRRILVLAVAVAALALTAATAAFAASPLTNPGFETGDLSGWNVDSGGAGEWNTTTTGQAFCGETPNAPWEGSYSALWDMEGPSGAILSQSFTVPASESLSFAFAYQNEAGEWTQADTPYDISGESANQWLRIDVLEGGADPGSLDPADIVATAFDSQSGSPGFSQGFQNVTVPLTGRAGDTLIFRVATVNTESCMPVWLDDVNGATPQVNRVGYCAVAGNTTPSGAAIAPGTFLDLASGQPDYDSHYKGALPANYYQGVGITCDNLPGYTKTTELVGYGGHGDPGPYTYYSKNA